MWNLEKYCENVAVISENGDAFTYRELNDNADKMAESIGKRCLIFCLCRNEIGSLVGYIGCLNNNIVPLMLSDHIDRELLELLIDNYKPDYLWIPSELKGTFSYNEVCKLMGYSLVKTGNDLVYPLYEKLALLLTTSGSTGSPKLVRQSYANIASNMEAIADYLELDATERPITTLPMNYTYGLSIINSHLSIGASIILTEKTLMQSEFWKQFKEYRATSFGGVPYTYEMLNRLKFFKMELPSLRSMTQAGGKLSPELHKKFAEYARENDKHFYVMYGQTEATARMSYLPYQKALEKYGSMGIAIPGGRLSLIDDQGNEIVEPEVVGELVYYGPNVTLGYAQLGEDLSKGDERSGKLITGDMAKQDADGFYYIVGRKKRFLKIFGNRVNLDEAERLIRSEFEEVECACTGIDDLMLVYIVAGEETETEQIRAFLSHKTGINQTAFKIRRIEQIPKNEAGKTLYTKLEEYYDGV